MLHGVLTLAVHSREFHVKFCSCSAVLKPTVSCREGKFEPWTCPTQPRLLGLGCTPFWLFYYLATVGVLSCSSKVVLLASHGENAVDHPDHFVARYFGLMV